MVAVVIEQAKGMVAERQGVTIDEAFASLRTHARNRNLLLSVVAEAVIDGRLAASTLDRPAAAG